MNIPLTKGVFLFALLSFAISAKAQYALKLADDQYNLYNYFNAADLYEKAYQKKPSLYIAQRLAGSYHQMRDYKNEESWYAIAVKAGTAPEDLLGYARALQNNSKYSEAKAAYQRYAKLNQPNNNQLNLWIASCDSAIKWMQHPNNTIIANQIKLNSAAADWGAILYNDKIVFASDRKDSADRSVKEYRKPLLKFAGNTLPDKKIYGWTGNSYLKLYQTPAGDSVGVAPTILPLEEGITYHTGPATFDKSGSEMYFTIDNPKPLKTKTIDNTETYKLKIFYSRKDPLSGKWQKPVSFVYNKTGASSGDPYITPNGNRLYFVSDMPGGKGGTDLYYCNRAQDGSWAVPVNIKELNTPGNERTPTADTEGNIYYATDGNITMGGLDIYKATYANGKFAGTQNLAYPVNSPQDDLAYQLAGDHTGYLSSDRIGGQGSDDIYKFSEKPALVIKLEGIVYDKTTLKPLPNAVITLTSETYIMNYSPDSTGNYSFALLADNKYILYGKKTGYTSDSQMFNTNGIKTSQVIHKDLYLEKIKINAPIVLNNINYDFDKANIRADARPALDHLIEVMQQNPTIWIELSSHTDSRGSDNYNLALSQRRAQSAVNYIILNGKINPNRITAKGYGETRLLNNCGNGVKCTADQHQVNRRTEFKITKQ